ncbi:MAG: GNAT family N-acetyltransferase [Planctomycetaceae bacterium]
MRDDIEIREEPMSQLPELARIPIAFTIDRYYDVTGDRPPFELVERMLDTPCVKDYDALFENGPSDWPRQFDLSNWGLLFAIVDGRRAGGAVIAFDTPGAEMLNGRRDLAALWDIRIQPEYRQRGIGRRLLASIDEWSRDRNCREIRLETQNINVPACRFYAKHGYSLASVKRNAYPELPDEIQFIWMKTL